MKFRILFSVVLVAILSGLNYAHFVSWMKQVHPDQLQRGR